MALNLTTDCTFTGPALPEPFVKFNLEAELNRLSLLPKAAGPEARALDEHWQFVRRKLRNLVTHGGGLRVQNHVIEPLLAQLGYARIEAVESVQTREGDEDGGALLVTEDGTARLRVWCVDLEADLDAPARRGLAYRFSHTRIAQRVLLATGERLGILTNGLELRLLISEPARVDSQVAISIDPHWKRSRDLPDSVRLLIALASPAGVKALPELINKARLQQAKVTKDLREQARHAIREFIQELLDHPDNQPILASLSSSRGNEAHSSIPHSALRIPHSEQGLLTSAPTNLYRIEIIDTGPGISTEAQAGLFQPFQQGGEGHRKGGTGLGLVISRRQVELMGGTLQLDSKIGRGSRFFFEVPLQAASSAVAKQTREVTRVVKHLASGHAASVLIVDDVLENRDVLSQILQSIGCEVVVAESGQRALDQLQLKVPDIIFMDIRMPGMDGKEAARRIWQQFGKERITLVALSASVFEHERQEYLEAGFDEFIGKPFRFGEICECLRTLLNVEFEYADSAVAAGGEGDIDPAQISLPVAILSQLREAAERYSVTRLEKCLEELDQDGEMGKRTAAHLRHLIRAGDLEGVSEFLKEVRCTGELYWKGWDAML
jgi:CheY-like chemotaxis protein